MRCACSLFQTVCKFVQKGKKKGGGGEKEKQFALPACLPHPASCFLLLPSSLSLPPSFSRSHIHSSSSALLVSMRTESVGYGVGGVGGLVVCVTCPQSTECVCMCTYDACCSPSHVSPGKSCSRLCQKTCFWHRCGNLDGELAGS